MTKIISNSIGYGIRRLSARGTRLKTRVITITYMPSSIPCFHENFRDALKAYAKVCGGKSKLEISEANSVYSLQPSGLLVFLLVSGAQTFMANFAIPAPKSSSTSTAGGRPAFQAMGRRVARKEEGGESQTRQDRRGARPQDHRSA